MNTQIHKYKVEKDWLVPSITDKDLKVIFALEVNKNKQCSVMLEKTSYVKRMK